MTDKEKIRAEIERRMNKHKYSTAITEMVYAEEDENLLSFIDSLPEEPSCPKESDDLEKAADEYALNCVCAGPYNSIGKFGFMAGAIWQQLKMMDGAVEGEIIKDIHNLLHVKSGPLPMPTKHRFGDRVKILILKDDEN